MAAACRAGIRRYVVEMVSRDPTLDPFEALRASAEYLRKTCVRRRERSG